MSQIDSALAGWDEDNKVRVSMDLKHGAVWVRKAEQKSLRPCVCILNGEHGSPEHLWAFREAVIEASVKLGIYSYGSTQ
jgi:hypothetical protein